MFEDSDGKRREIVIASSVISAVAVLLLLGLYLFNLRRKRKNMMRKNQLEDESHPDLQFWDLSVVLKATDNLSSNNKLGEGGFGPVYKVISFSFSYWYLH